MGSRMQHGKEASTKDYVVPGVPRAENSTYGKGAMEYRHRVAMTLEQSSSILLKVETALNELAVDLTHNKALMVPFAIVGYEDNAYFEARMLGYAARDNSRVKLGVDAAMLSACRELGIEYKAPVRTLLRRRERQRVRPVNASDSAIRRDTG